MEAKDPILELRGVSKWFGGVRALDGVDLRVCSRQVVAVVGDNGAGKSTLMRIIAGVHRPDRGSIYVDGELVEIRDVATARRLGIELVHQDLALVNNMDAAYNVFLGRTPRRWRWFVDHNQMAFETRKILVQMGIQNIPDLSSPVDGLSGGQRQLLAIARAVKWNSRVVILDEPTAALGVEESEAVLRLITELKEHAGTAVIVVSHNLQHVLRVADEIVVLYQGRRAATVRRSEAEVDEVVRLITTGDGSRTVNSRTNRMR